MRKMIRRKVFYISGGFDPFNKPSQIRKLEKLIQEDDNEIVIDLKNLHYMHFETGNLLEELKEKLRSKGKKLKLKNVNDYFLKVLNLSGNNWNLDLTK
ncbi:STAS domain-containing protein [candidate division WOR-3 bacterium]|nr:STAS domain-containing protein [candidate division WOR-3 bacterium]